VSGFKHSDRIQQLAKLIGTRDILDYGCGAQTLAKSLPFAITNYDPFIVGLDAEPGIHDLVICSDVLEHIEPECLDAVFQHLFSKVGKGLSLDIACRPAKKVLADGRNTHLIQETPSWWLMRILPSLEPMFTQSYAGGFVGVFTPKAVSA
jgi:2-polyprenyl-3-methyl-5-hydroxy-6-metoxy-1,4-benzoquinol methylase